MALHSTVNRNTGFTANKWMLDRESTQPIHLLLGLPNTSAQSGEHDPWILELAENLKTLHKYARQSLKAGKVHDAFVLSIMVYVCHYNVMNYLF
jgi:hypothetical protein